MGADEVQIDLTKIVGVADEMTGIQNKITGILNKLNAATTARGKPWGDDSYGNKFYGNGTDDTGYGASYTGKNGLAASTAGMASTFEQAAEILNQAKQVFDGTESGAANSFGA